MLTIRRFVKNIISAFKVFNRLLILQLRLPRLSTRACQLWWVKNNLFAIAFANILSVYLLSTSKQRGPEKAEHNTWHAHHRILRFYHSFTFHYLLFLYLFWSIVSEQAFTKIKDITFRDALHNFLSKLCCILV